MSKVLSSSRADPGATSVRGAWPWLLAAGPAVVVVASFASAWLAVSRADPVVAENYYKLGLTINLRLPAMTATKLTPTATIVIGAVGAVSVRAPDTATVPTYVKLTLHRPGDRDSEVEMLDASGAGTWSGTLHDVRAGRHIVTLESDAWQLPVTIVERLPATINLGGADAKS